MCACTKQYLNERMKPKLNKNLSLPWTPQGEKASGNHQIAKRKRYMYELNFPHMLS